MKSVAFRQWLALALTLIGYSFCTASAVAVDQQANPSPKCQGDCVAIGDWQVSVSVGYGVRTNPVLGQEDIQYVVVPEVSYYGKRFFLENFDFGFTAYDKGNHQFNALLFTPGFEQSFFNKWNLRNFDLTTSSVNGGVAVTPDEANEFNSDENQPLPALRLSKRRTAVLSGLEYTFIHENFDWQVQVLQDVSKTHHGQKIRTAITLPWIHRKDLYQLSFGITWKSDKLIDYYYGIDKDEVYSDKLVYQAPSSTTFYAKAEWERRINKRWGIRGLISYRKLDDAYTDSPIIHDSGIATAFFAGVYHF